MIFAAVAAVVTNGVKWIDGKDLTDKEKPILEAAMPDTFIQYCYGLMARNGWRDLQNYFDMRDLLGMPYNTW